MFLLLKHLKRIKTDFGPKKMVNLVKNTFVIWVWKSFSHWAAQNSYLKKHCIRKWNIAVKHLDPCFLTTFVKKVLRGTFGEIWRIQIQIYLKTNVELKYGACYLKNKVRAHRLGLVVQLSWRVAPPYPLWSKSSEKKRGLWYQIWFDWF